MMNSQKKRLLVIDDEENMRHMLSTMMAHGGYDTETASDGIEGLRMVELAREEGRPYDFVLCDIKMPRMDGMEILKSGREKLVGTTVIVMSA